MIQPTAMCSSAPCNHPNVRPWQVRFYKTLWIFALKIIFGTFQFKTWLIKRQKNSSDLRWQSKMITLSLVLMESSWKGKRILLMRQKLEFATKPSLQAMFLRKILGGYPKGNVLLKLSKAERGRPKADRVKRLFKRELAQLALLRTVMFSSSSSSSPIICKKVIFDQKVIWVEKVIHVQKVICTQK